MKIISKASFVYASFLLAAASAFYAPELHAQTTSSQATALLKRTDQSTAFMDSDFAANYSMVQSKPGQGNSNVQAIMYRRDSAQSYTILITAPSRATSSLTTASGSTTRQTSSLSLQVPTKGSRGLTQTILTLCPSIFLPTIL